MVQGARLLAFSRGYATHRRASRLNGALSLDHLQANSHFREQFLQRQRALSLYRTILRGTKNIRDPATKAESRHFAREEFERHRNVTDLQKSHIRYLLSTGKTEWENMERYIGGM
ncbi:hypothetical protein ACO1O0_003259 [Amphichorda felina]